MSSSAKTGSLKVILDQHQAANCLEQLRREHRVPRRRSRAVQRTNPDRRGSHRVPMQLPFYLFPAVREGDELTIPETEPLLAVTRDISLRGIGFQCDAAIPCEIAVAEFSTFSGRRISLLVELVWSRKKDSHYYIGGCLALGVLQGSLG